jgi:hypothetical protein
MMRVFMCMYEKLIFGWPKHHDLIEPTNRHIYCQTTHHTMAMLYDALVERRVNLANYFQANLHVLEYDALVQEIHTIYQNHAHSIAELLDGTTYQHNKRMAISIIPTANLYRIVSQVMRMFDIDRFEDIGTGVGLLPCVFTALEQLNVIVPRVFVGSDPTYALATSIKLAGTTVARKDMCDYVLDDQFDPDTMYMMVDPTGDMLRILRGLFAIRRPKIVMIISERHIVSDHYQTIQLRPKIVSREDTLHGLGSHTHYQLSVMIRNDLYRPIDSSMFEMDMLEDYTEPEVDLIRRMVEYKIAPQCLGLVDPHQAKRLVTMLSQTTICELPKHLETIDEVEIYMNMCQLAYDDTGIVPTALHRRDNFVAMRRYMDMVYSDYNGLVDLMVVPARVDPADAMHFLLRDYCYDDKIATNIYMPFMGR